MFLILFVLLHDHHSHPGCRTSAHSFSIQLTLKNLPFQSFTLHPRSRLPFSTVSMQLRPLWHLEIHIALEALDLGDSVLTNSTIFASPKKREAAKSISKAMEICLEVSINTQKWPWLEFLGFIALIFISHYCVEEPSLYQRTNSYHESLLKLIQKSCWQASSSGMHLLKMLEEWMNVSQHCLGP